MTSPHLTVHPDSPAPPRLMELPTLRPLVALWGGLAVLDAGRLVGAAPLVELAAVTALVAVCSCGAGKVVAACVAVIGWMLVNGFVVHRLGELGFVGTGDVVRAGLLLVVALVSAELTR